MSARPDEALPESPLSRRKLGTAVRCNERGPNAQPLSERRSTVTPATRRSDVELTPCAQTYCSSESIPRAWYLFKLHFFDLQAHPHRNHFAVNNEIIRGL